MPHSWNAYELAKSIAESLHEAGLIAEKDLLMVRGIIQITMEDRGGGK